MIEIDSQPMESWGTSTQLSEEAYRNPIHYKQSIELSNIDHSFGINHGLLGHHCLIAAGSMFWDLNVAWDPKRAAAFADLALRPVEVGRFGAMHCNGTRS